MMRALTILLASLPAWGACAGLFTGTPCTATVGTASRNYSTVQACIDAIPANLVTDGNSYVCSLYNDSEFTAAVSITGRTMDATHTITVTAAAGQSFQDHANVRANALKYDQTKGVGIRKAEGYGVTFAICGTCEYVTISRLQIYNDINDGTGSAVVATTNNTIANNILIGSRSSLAVVSGSQTTFVNNVIVELGTGHGLSADYGSLVVGNTIVKPSNVAGTGTGLLNSAGTTGIVRSNAIFGFATASSGSWGASSSNNATNLASGLPGSSNTYNVTYSSSTPFTGAASGAQDWRAVSATALASAGYRDSTNAPNDISGYPRAASPTVGAWELTSAAAAVVRRRLIQ